MKVVCFAGYSGAGKTALIEQLIVALKAGGERVSVLKHAHHKFDIDRPGKDSWRHREAGAFEVLLASSKRMALMREFADEADLSVHQLLAELSTDVDWVLVEGFKHSDLPKVEVWREAADKPALYPEDERVIAIATDSADRLPQKTQRPVLDLNRPQAVIEWLQAHVDRFEYSGKL